MGYKNKYNVGDIVIEKTSGCKGYIKEIGTEMGVYRYLVEKCKTEDEDIWFDGSNIDYLLYKTWLHESKICKEKGAEEMKYHMNEIVKIKETGLIGRVEGRKIDASMSNFYYVMRDKYEPEPHIIREWYKEKELEAIR